VIAPTLLAQCVRSYRGPPRGSAVLQPVAQPHRAAFENLTAFQRHREERSAHIALVLAGIEGVGPAPRAVDRRADREADLVDQAGPQKRAVRLAAAFANLRPGSSWSGQMTTSCPATGAQSLLCGDCAPFIGDTAT
jgi:hypothetical protein